MLFHLVLTNFANFFPFPLSQRMAKWSEQHNGKYPDPHAKLTFKEEERKEKKKKKKKKKKDKRPLQPITGANGSKVRANLLIYQ